MPNAQQLGGDAQFVGQALYSAFPYGPGNAELQSIRGALESHERPFGANLLESRNRESSQMQPGRSEVIERNSLVLDRGSFWETLPNELLDIAKEIASSRYILELEADDDEEGMPCNQDTWSRAATLVARMSLSLLSEDRGKIDTPSILPGPQGSIDIHWDKADYELLINVPADQKISAAFYGDNKGKSKIKGNFDIDKESDTPLLAYRTLRYRQVK